MTAEKLLYTIKILLFALFGVLLAALDLSIGTWRFLAITILTVTISFVSYSQGRCSVDDTKLKELMEAFGKKVT